MEKGIMKGNIMDTSTEVANPKKSTVLERKEKGKSMCYRHNDLNYPLA